LFLRNLQQFPPVFESPVYVTVSSETALKLTGCVGAVDLWRNLFEYDELVINMHQKEEKEFASISLQNCYSKEGLSTAPWSFLLSVTPLLSFLLPYKKVRNS